MEHKVIGAGILAIDKNTGKILLGRRSLVNDDNGGGFWAPFGGTFDAVDKHPKKTAKREFMEETGCRIPYKISKLPFYINNTNTLTFYTYIGIFDDMFAAKLIPEETIDYGWFDLDNMPDALLPGVKKMFDDKMIELKLLIKKI